RLTLRQTVSAPLNRRPACPADAEPPWLDLRRPRRDSNSHRASRLAAMALRILVAEDETIIRLDLRALLENAGFEVCAEARDGLEAVELARSEEPDLAILDVKMPKLDGIRAPRRRRDERPV